MSRWYMTSNKQAHEEAEKICKRANLKTSVYMSNGYFQIQAYHKRAFDTSNFVECGQGNWICSAGTLVYNGHLGEATLHAFYSDFDKYGIQTVRTRAVGHYAVSIKCGNEMQIFTDPQGACGRKTV